MIILKIAGVATAALVLATAFAQAGNTAHISTNVIKLAKVAGCEVAGTPSEFPDDIWVVNKGVGKLAAGTQVKWSIPGYNNLKGTHTLVAQLNPGQGVKLSGVLPGGVEAGHACKAQAL